MTMQLQGAVEREIPGDEIRYPLPPACNVAPHGIVEYRIDSPPVERRQRDLRAGR